MKSFDPKPKVAEYDRLSKKLETTESKTLRAAIETSMGGIKKALRNMGYDTAGKPFLPVSA